MKLEYTLKEEDYLSYQLFSSSTNSRIQRNRRNGWFGLTAISFVIALLFYNRDFNLFIYFVVVGIMILLFYPLYFKWRYRRHYRVHIRETYEPSFGEPIVVELGDEYIRTKDRIGEGKYKLSEFLEVNELPDYFFLRLYTNLSLIIPKKEVTDVDVLRAKFEEIKLKVNDFRQWKW